MQGIIWVPIINGNARGRDTIPQRDSSSSNAIPAHSLPLPFRVAIAATPIPHRRRCCTLPPPRPSPVDTATATAPIPHRRRCCPPPSPRLSPAAAAAAAVSAVLLSWYLASREEDGLWKLLLLRVGSAEPRCRPRRRRPRQHARRRRHQRRDLRGRAGRPRWLPLRPLPRRIYRCHRFPRRVELSRRVPEVQGVASLFASSTQSIVDAI